MTRVYLVGAKGGVGTSIVATNLALRLVSLGPTLLVDGMRSGSIDLLLGMPSRESWRALLPVANELKQRHVSAATRQHDSGLEFLASADSLQDNIPFELTTNLAKLTKHLVVDAPAACLLDNAGAQTDRIQIVVVTTLDPPSLRRCRQTVRSFVSAGFGPPGLVLNQTTPSHPAESCELADALGATVLAEIPFAPEVVFKQVEFGIGHMPLHSRRWNAAFRQLGAAVTGAQP